MPRICPVCLKGEAREGPEEGRQDRFRLAGARVLEGLPATAWICVIARAMPCPEPEPERHQAKEEDFGRLQERGETRDRIIQLEMSWRFHFA